MRGCLGYILILVGAFFILGGAVSLWFASNEAGDSGEGIFGLVLGFILAMIGAWLRGPD